MLKRVNNNVLSIELPPPVTLRTYSTLHILLSTRWQTSNKKMQWHIRFKVKLLSSRENNEDPQDAISQPRPRPTQRHIVNPEEARPPHSLHVWLEKIHSPLLGQ